MQLNASFEVQNTTDSPGIWFATGLFQILTTIVAVFAADPIIFES